MFDNFCFSVELGVLLDGCPVFANLFVFGATRAAPQSLVALRLLFCILGILTLFWHCAKFRMPNLMIRHHFRWDGHDLGYTVDTILGTHPPLISGQEQLQQTAEKSVEQRPSILEINGHTIHCFLGMSIKHLPAILRWTEGQQILDSYPCHLV